MFKTNGVNSIARGTFDNQTKSSRENDDLLEPSGDNDEPIFDLAGCLPAC